MTIRFPGSLTILVLLAAGVMSCQADNAPLARLPNPAVAKCLSDGWRTEPVLTNGVPTDTVCIHPATGQRCLSWSYFRGECPPIDHKGRSDIAPKSK
jgi:putative hemolysin